LGRLWDAYHDCRILVGYRGCSPRICWRHPTAQFHILALGYRISTIPAVCR
jgi:hypothetical protein